MFVARDYDKELADAQAKVKRIREAKAAAERRRYEPVGRAMYEVFGDELAKLKSAKDVKAFCRRLRDVYDASHAGAPVSDATEAEPPVKPYTEPHAGDADIEDFE